MYTIADLCVKMEPHHALTAHRAEAYKTERETADVVIPPFEGDASAEYAALAYEFYNALLSFDGFLLHASAVEYDGKAYLFSATSGTGKSTHASFWQSQLGAKVINDDKPAIRFLEGVAHACGTPFSGKENKSRNVCVPIGAVVILRRGEQTRVEPIRKSEALFRLLDQTVRPLDTVLFERLLELAQQLIETVPMYVAYVPYASESAREVAQQICI